MECLLNLPHFRNVLGNTLAPGDWDWSLVTSIRGQSVACLAAAWLLVAVCLIKGVKTSGKVSETNMNWNM